MNWKASASGPPPAAMETLRIITADGGEALKGERQVYLAASNSFRAVPVYNRYALAPGDTLHGPALVEENESTAVLGAGDVATLDAAGNLVVSVGA